MDSSLDILGRAIGLAYTLFTPIFGYFLLRAFAPLRARDIALGVFGFAAIVLLARGPVGYVASALAGRLLAEANSRPSDFALFFVSGSCFFGAVALLNEAACFALLKYGASQRQGTGPGFAYAIGAAAGYCLMVAIGELRSLQLALVQNGDYVSARVFAYGIPQGAAAASRSLIEVILASLVWRGIVEKKAGLIGWAILLDVILAVIYSLLLALTPLTPHFIHESLFGLVTALSYFWAPPVLRLPGRFLRFRKCEPVIEDDGGVRAGLLSTWRNQRWRSD